jgi:hypothetical protein
MLCPLLQCSQWFPTLVEEPFTLRVVKTLSIDRLCSYETGDVVTTGPHHGHGVNVTSVKCGKTSITPHQYYWCMR